MRSKLAVGELFLSELHGIRRRLWLQRIAHAAWRGLWVGLGALLVTESLARFARASTESLLIIALIPLLTVVGGVVWSVLRRPTLVTLSQRRW